MNSTLLDSDKLKKNRAPFSDAQGWRWYPKDDKYYISVTTVLKFGTPYIGVVASQSTLENAGTWGTELHKIFENILTGAGNSDIPDDKKPHVKEFEDFLNQHKVDVVSLETKGYNEERGTAGTWDAIWKMNGKTVLVDYKTGRDWDVTYGWQMSEYRRMAIQKEIVDEDCGLLGLHIPRRSPKLKLLSYRHIDGMELAFAATLQSLKWKYWKKFNELEWPWLTKPAVILPNLINKEKSNA